MGQERNLRWERRIQRDVVRDFKDNKVLFENWINAAHLMNRHFRRSVQLVTDIYMMHPNPSDGFNRAQRRHLATLERAKKKAERATMKRLMRNHS